MINIMTVIVSLRGCDSANESVHIPLTCESTVRPFQRGRLDTGHAQHGRHRYVYKWIERLFGDARRNAAPDEANCSMSRWPTTSCGNSDELITCTQLIRRILIDDHRSNCQLASKIRSKCSKHIAFSCIIFTNFIYICGSY